MNIKAVFFDIDGTLISHRKHAVPETTVQAIHQLQKQGILTFVATGRHRTEIERLLPKTISFDAYLSLNGMYCYNAEEVILSESIPAADIRSLIEMLHEKPFPCAFVNRDEIYINYTNTLVETVQKDISSSPIAVKDMDDALQQEIYQVMSYGLDDAEITAVLKRMPHCKSTAWHPMARDIIIRNGGKEAGIRKMLSYYRLDPEEVMAFGDGDNDVGMFQAVGTAVAMGNANSYAKSNADYVTTDIDEDGILYALKHFGIFHEILIKE